MKVCTDACLFGAWFSKNIFTKPNNNQRLLDIGCGTGLLSLMVAQQHNLQTDAIEIDTAAVQQAKENIALTPWVHQINIHHTSIQNYNVALQYDFIISNPPFFEEQLKSNNNQRNVAMHATALSFNDLCKAMQRYLKDDGTAAILIPFYAVEKFETILKFYNLFIIQQTNVAHTPSHPFFRAMLFIQKIPSTQSNTVLYIRDEMQQYHTDFKTLLKDYYLQF